MADYLITRLPRGTTRAEIVQFFNSIKHPFLVSPKVDEITGFMLDFEESATGRSNQSFPLETKGSKAASGIIKSPQRLVPGQHIGVQSKCGGLNPFSIQGASSLFRPVGGSVESSGFSLLQRESRGLNAVDILTETASGGPPSIVFSSGNPNVLDSIVKNEEEPEDRNPLVFQDPSCPQPTHSLFPLETHAEALMEEDATVVTESFVKEEINDDEFDDREDRDEEDGGKTLKEAHQATDVDAAPSDNDGSFKCDVCHIGFSSFSSLVGHLPSHADKASFLCNVCGKQLASKHSLSIHRRMHTGEQPFKCDVCDKRFRIKANKSQHMRIHTGEKPYKCSECDKEFRHLGTISEHRRRVHGIPKVPRGRPRRPMV